MAIEVIPLSQDIEISVSPERPGASLPYMVTGTEDELAASAAFEAVVSAFYYGLLLQDYTMRHKGGGVWDFTAKYGTRENMQPADGSGSGSGSGPGGGGPAETKSANFSFDSTGGTKKITHSIATIAQYQRAGTTATPRHNAINVQPDGKIEGVEIGAGQFSFVVERALSHPINPALVAAIDARTWHVNSDTVVLLVDGITITCAPGELLYKGATGGKNGTEGWRVSLHCARSPNVTGLIVGEIIGIAKKGWEYLWVWSDETVDPTSNRMIQRPQEVYIEQVYPTAALGILFL